MILAFASQVSPATLTLDLSKPGVAVSPDLYGQMTEEINHSYDGGLYGELVRNRAFLDDAKAPAHWSPVGKGASVALTTSGPSAARPASLLVRGGTANDGYWGFPVRPRTAYRVSLWAKADRGGPIAASLESPDGATVYARTEVEGVSGEWRKISATMRTEGVAPTKDAWFVLRTGAGRSVWLAQASLFPPTYKDRPNGNRPDLMAMLADMRPRFLRLPGGNYVEGNYPEERFPWKETLGRVEDRPGHLSPWGYRSTDGMGLMEFLRWCEDTGAKPVLGVYAGYAITGVVAKPGRELAAFVQEALEEIEFAIGGPDTKWGAERARLGHPAPFPLECVEVGNEDGFDKSGSYEARFVQFYDAIKAKYPEIKVISSVAGKEAPGEKSPVTQRQPDLCDEHFYSEAWDMMGLATRYDGYVRDGSKVFVGEWASYDTLAPWQAGALGPTPNVKCALGDAAFLTGLERNSDVVRMACYAPLLVNVNPGGRQWSLNLIGYDALSAFGSPSYYVQRIFAENLGDRTVPLTLSGAPTQTQGDRTLPALFASATRDDKAGALYVKVVNPLPTAQEVAFEVRGGAVGPDGTMTVLSGDPKAVNSIAEPTKVVPVTTRLRSVGSPFRLTLASSSVAVLRLSLRR